MTYPVNHIDRHFSQLEETSEKLFRLIKPFSEEIYFSQPSPGKWSVGQIVNHVFLSEKLSFAYLQKKISYPNTLQKFHFKSWGGVLLLKLALRLPVKTRAPKAIDMWGGQTVLSLSEIEPQWRSLRKDLIHFIKTHEAEYGSHLVYRHPYAGRMTLDQMLIFFNDHMKHHIRQISRTIKQEKKGKTGDS